ncbi:MAG: alpha/beta hydrolase [Rhodobiaceae bacterium]|jgi:phosphinothricin tripeptide acetyl hydrolase|nr:alpha/beta hydrolase [Rhodobiaceae bacterium]
MSLQELSMVREMLKGMAADEERTLEDFRTGYDQAGEAFGVSDGVAVEKTEIAGVPGEWLKPEGVGGEKALLYLHGGGYALGSVRSHRHMCAAIALALGSPVLLIDYRRAPEHPFPAAVDDAVAVYRALLGSGYEASNLAIAGDSAGGGLTVATLVAVRDGGLSLPAAAVCISPWANLENVGGSYAEKADIDPMVQHPDLERWTDAYLGAGDRKAPLASPVYADLAGLPPILVQVGESEVLLSDSELLTQRLKATGVPVTLKIWPDMIHVWHWFGPILSEGRAATDEMASFIRVKLGQ